MKGPEIYLKELGIILPCAVDATARAQLDFEHRIRVNWETFFVSSDQALAAFKEAPYKYSGLVTDPVSRTRFEPTSSSPMREAEGHVFYFLSPESAKTFDDNPVAYTTPMIGMSSDM